MMIFVCLELGLLSVVPGFRFLRTCRRRRAVHDPLRSVFGAKEMRLLDAHLERTAEVERSRMDAVLAQYVAGAVGHVVRISASQHGVALGLSDGGRLALGGVSLSSLSMLRRRATDEKLYPAGVVRDALSYRLVLRAEHGTDIELSSRRLALAPAP